MLQQNQPKQEINNTIDAPIGLYPKRQFIIEGVLGRGKNSQVFLAKPVQWGTFQNKVALKFRQSYKDEMKQLYQKVIEYQNKFETQNNQNDNQSNFIRIYDQFDYSEYLVTVMEVGQNDLSSYQKKYQNITFQQKQLFCKQMLQSIIFLHSLNVIHKDISLDCYLMIGLSVKLVNFGFANKRTNFKGFDIEDVIVNQKFKPPETYNQEYTAAADVWSLACIFYEIMKGSSLFQGKNLEELRQQKENQSYISEKIDDLQITDEWKQTMKKMLYQQPNLRISPKDAMEQLSKKSSAFIIQKFSQPNFVAQQQYPIAQQSQNQFRQFNQDIQQPQLQSSIVIQINAMITALDQPNSINQLLQQKEQSRKLLVSLKDKIQQLQNQFENNITSLEPVLSFDNNQQNQKPQQKELPPAVQQSLDEIKKRCLDIEEKCISNSEQAVLNQNLQTINKEIEILKNNTENLDRRQKEYQELQQQVNQLKEGQKAVMKSKILEEELQLLKKENQAKRQALSLQKEIETSNKNIIELEQSVYTINYLQDQKLKQQIQIDNLKKEISIYAALENEIKIQGDELLELKCQQKQYKFLEVEIQNNVKTIESLKVSCQQLPYVQKSFEEQQQEIEKLKQQLSQLDNLQAEIKKNTNLITQMKNKNYGLTQLQKDAEKLKKEISSLESDFQKTIETEKQIANLSEQKQQLKEQQQQKLEQNRNQEKQMLEYK
ncbi:unnamed protein product [Paramecium octaurelia]|uniref:Protein kinase domain-containing protein n=1 Tax=Paramecium octaurelia TaxID=43137 RepID=A0A8S1UG74_PAROT|nr:unnamed protein product [Paramecium octaurelia]